MGEMVVAQGGMVASAKGDLFSSDAFAGKTLLVTGGASGIGLATARLFSRKGAKVAIVDWNAETGAAAAESIKDGGGEAVFIKCDVTDESQVEKAVAATVKAFDSIDVLFCNAGTYGPVKLVHETPLKEWDRILDTDLNHVFLFCKHAVPQMQKQGGGAIINNASEAGFLGIPTYSAYSSAKAGVILLTQTLCGEYGRDNIRVNVVCPASVDTPMMDEELEVLREDKEATRNAIKARSPFKRMCTAEEVASTVMFLASPEASFITGEKVVIDGGMTAAGSI